MIEEIIVQTIIERLPVGLIVIRPQGEIVVANRAASNILGVAIDPLKKAGWMVFLEREGNDDFNQVILDAIQYRETNLHRTVPYVRPSGETLTLSITSSFLSKDDRAAGMVILIDDLTELHRLHERQKKILEEKNRLQIQKAESLRHLSEAVAHQIRNPVTSVGGFALRLRKRAAGKEPESTYIGYICQGAERLQRIVRAVNDYAAIPEPNARKAAVEEIVELALQRIQKACKDESSGVQWMMDLRPVKARVDPDLMVMAVEELLRNAVQSLERGRGRISVRIGSENGSFHIEVEDTGRGIIPEDLPYIQNPFFTTRADALGMGLCRVKRICLDHGGRMDVCSEPGKGTRVRLAFAESRGATPEGRPSEDAAPGGDGRSSRSPGSAHSSASREADGSLDPASVDS